MGTVVALIFSDLLVLSWDTVTGQRSPRGGPIPWTRLADPPINDMTPGGMRLRRMLDCRIVDPASGREVHLRTNALGYRGGPILPKEQGEYRILVLGDSITVSLHTEEAETYPAMMERLLCDADPGVVQTSPVPVSAPTSAVADESCRFRVINAAMRGAGLREELLILTETGLLTQPDLVLVGLYLNDAKRSRVYPLPEGLAAYSAIARKLSDIALRNEMSDEARERWEHYAGRPFPSEQFPADAWRTDPDAFEVEKAKAACDWGFSWFSAAWDEMSPDMQLMKDLSARHDFKLAVVLFPSTLQVEAAFLDDTPQEFCAEMMREMDLPYMDLLPIFREAYRTAGRSLAYDNCHLTPEGNAVAGEAIFRFLRPLIAEAEQVSN